MVFDAPGIGLFFAAQGAQLFHRAPDGRDIAVLGNDEGYQRFPRVLTQDADASAMLRRGVEEGVLCGIDSRADGGVAFPQVKIVLPSAVEFVLAAVEGIIAVPQG